MSTLPWKIRIAVLWAIGPILELYHVIFFLRLDEKGAARLGNLAIHTTIMFIIPLLMCLLSLTLRDKVNKWVNLVLGIFYGVIGGPIWFLEGGIGVIMYDGPPLGVHFALLIGLKVIVTLFIPWFAWKWPKQQARLGG